MLYYVIMLWKWKIIHFWLSQIKFIICWNLVKWPKCKIRIIEDSFVAYFAAPLQYQTSAVCSDAQMNRAQTLIESSRAPGPGVWDLCAFLETNTHLRSANTDDQCADIKRVFEQIWRDQPRVKCSGEAWCRRLARGFDLHLSFWCMTPHIKQPQPAFCPKRLVVRREESWVSYGGFPPTRVTSTVNTEDHVSNSALMESVWKHKLRLTLLWYSTLDILITVSNFTTTCLLAVIRALVDCLLNIL